MIQVELYDAPPSAEAMPFRFVVMRNISLPIGDGEEINLQASMGVAFTEYCYDQCPALLDRIKQLIADGGLRPFVVN